MKSNLAALSLLTTLLCTSLTNRATAQRASEEWLSDTELCSVVVESFGDDPALDQSSGVCGCSNSPTWTFGADAVFMQRSRPDSLVLMQDTGVPARNLNADAFGFDFTTGWDVTLERNTCDGGLEARLLSIDGWNSAATAIVGAPTLVQINNAIPFFAPGVTSIDATYNSELLSAELNLRRQLRESVRLLGGFRYLELDEHFHANLNNVAVLPTTYGTLTRNRLYGFQLGADATLWCRDRLTIEGLAKAGIFHNSAGQQTVYNTGLAVAAANDTSNRAAFVGELAFTANYCLTDRLTLRGGYDLLWLETVALASDQIPATDFAAGNGINAAGGVFYHGAFVGLEYRR